MRLYSVEGNGQRLDGGAMFGNAPRALWSRWLSPDELGRVRLACRALLVETDDGRRILLETGVGAFFEPRLRERFGVESSEHVLLKNLATRGLTDADIDVVVLSHMHFDHVGGLLAAWEEGAPPRLLFPNARFVVGREAFARAEQPHTRDRASFIPGLTALLRETGRLELVAGERSDALGDGFRFTISEGHTPGLLVTTLETPGGPLSFVADLAPGVPWLHLPITMGYDRFPERLIDEKRAVFERVVAEGGGVFLTHDPNVAVAELLPRARGSFEAGETWKILDGAWR